MLQEDEEEEVTNVVRYPVLPSLVALQQMRNRLHLAFVGKKLMKWTALATGRELRNISTKMVIAYDTFREDIRNAYMLLARARYFNQEINKMALENLCDHAALKVRQTSRPIAGVKVSQIQVIDYEFDSYEHLGIEKGGRAVTEAKKAWRDLLKRLIYMLMLRIGFVDLERANRKANMRQNVLQRIVVPRTTATMKYILDELEEKEREEFYRIKKIIANKLKAKERKKKELVITAVEEPIPEIESIKEALEKKILEEKEAIEKKVLEEKEAIEKKNLEEKEAIGKKNLEEKEAIEKKNLKEKEAIGILPIKYDAFKHLEDKEATEKERAQKESELLKIPCPTCREELVKTALEKKASEEKEAIEKEGGRLEPEAIKSPCPICMDALEKTAFEQKTLEEKETMEKEKTMEKAGGEKMYDQPMSRIIKVCSCDKDKESIKSEKSIVTTDGTKLEDLELGVLEIEVVETTKIIRVKNEDGTVSEKTKFIRKKREKMIPMRPETVLPLAAMKSNDSTRTESRASKGPSQHSSRTVGHVTLSEPRIMRSFCKAQSETMPSMSLMADSFEESNIISTESYVISNNMSTRSYTLCENSQQCLRKSSTELEEMLQLHELRNYNNMIQTSSKYINASKEICCSSDSEIRLLNNSKNKSNIGNCKSTDELKKHKAENNKFVKSISFSTKDNSDSNSGY